MLVFTIACRFRRLLLAVDDDGVSMLGPCSLCAYVLFSILVISIRRGIHSPRLCLATELSWATSPSEGSGETKREPLTIDVWEVY